MDFAGEILVVVALTAGGIFGLVGSLGLLKLDNPMARLHAPTKASTLGVGSVLVASVLYAAFFGGRASVHEILIMIFLFMTAPVSANFIAKAHLHRHVKGQDLPPAEPDSHWAHVGDDGDEDGPENG